MPPLEMELLDGRVMPLLTGYADEEAVEEGAGYIDALLLLE